MADDKESGTHPGVRCRRQVRRPRGARADGPRDRWSIARLLSEILGRNIAAAVAERPGTESPIGKMFEYYDRHDVVGNPLVLRAILGREPRSLRDFFQDLALDRAA